MVALQKLNTRGAGSHRPEASHPYGYPAPHLNMTETEPVEVKVLPYEGYELTEWELRSNPDRNGLRKIEGIDCKTSWPTEVEVGQHLVRNNLTLEEVKKVERGPITTWILGEYMHNDKIVQYNVENHNKQWVIILEEQTELVQAEIKLHLKMREIAHEHVKKKIEEAEAKGEPLFKPTRFRHKETGEIVTQINLMQIKNYEKLDD